MKTKTPKNLPEKEKSNSTSTPEDRLQEAFIDTDEMIEFLDARDTAHDAAERGDKEVTLPAALLARILAITQPFDLDHLRRAWNRVCDELDMPDQKQPLDEPTGADMTTGKKVAV